MILPLIHYLVFLSFSLLQYLSNRYKDWKNRYYNQKEQNSTNNEELVNNNNHNHNHNHNNNESDDDDNTNEDADGN